MVQQPIAIDDSIASDQVSRSSELIEEDEDSEGHYDQQYKEPRDPQDYLETMPSASGSTAYGPMKSKGNVPRVHLIVAEDDEEGIVLGEESKGIHVSMCIFMHIYAMHVCAPVYEQMCACIL